MNVPPVIRDEEVREVVVEVLPPQSQREPEIFAAPRNTKPTDPAPVHALSALVLVAVDSLWTVFDLAPPLWPFAVPLCFLAVFFPVYLAQRHLKEDSQGKALAYAVLLAVLAAIPTPITGTPVGLALLAWSGLGKLMPRTPVSPPARSVNT